MFVTILAINGQVKPDAIAKEKVTEAEKTILLEKKNAFLEAQINLQNATETWKAANQNMMTAKGALDGEIAKTLKAHKCEGCSLANDLTIVKPEAKEGKK